MNDYRVTRPEEGAVGVRFGAPRAGALHLGKKRLAATLITKRYQPDGSSEHRMTPFGSAF